MLSFAVSLVCCSFRNFSYSFNMSASKALFLKPKPATGKTLAPTSCQVDCNPLWQVLEVSRTFKHWPTGTCWSCGLTCLSIPIYSQMPHHPSQKGFSNLPCHLPQFSFLDSHISVKFTEQLTSFSSSIPHYTSEVAVMD